jgi:hypothetical protein
MVVGWDTIELVGVNRTNPKKYKISKMQRIIDKVETCPKMI